MSTRPQNSNRGLRSLTGEELFRLYGPTIALIAAIALLVVLLPTENPSGPGANVAAGVTGNAGATGTTTVEGAVPSGGGSAGAESGVAGSASASAGPAGSESSGAATANASGPAALNGATTADGKAAVVDKGDDCRADGREVGVSVWQPPCVAWKPGADNGGATARGVTRDKVTVVFNLAELNTAAFAVGTAAGIQQSPDQVETYSKLWLNYYNNHTQTYGRQVEFKFKTASGSDDAALRADVQRAALEDKAFAFIGACCNQAQLQATGAQKLVAVTSPGQPLASDMAQNPYSITRAPTVEWVFEDAGKYICQRLNGRPAKWAGDSDLKSAPRKFGLLYSASTGPSGSGQGPAVPVLEKAVSECGQRFAAKVGISSDESTWSNEGANAIAKMKAAGVTTLVYFAPILSQVFVAQAADRQLYHPEWYVGGTCCNDAVIVNRAVSQSQASHFFGTSNQFAWWRDDASTFEAVREAVIGNNRQPLPNVGQSGSATNNAALTGTIWWPLIQGFFGCLQMAGPTLTPETWRKGCDLYGKAGGYIKDFPFPLRFFTPDKPFMIQDQAEWWWNPNVTCNDEANRSGQGCSVWVQNGRRTGFQAWPNSEPDMFNPATANLTPNMPPVWPDPGRPLKKCLSCA